MEPSKERRVRRLWTFSLLSWVFSALLIASYFGLYTDAKDPGALTEVGVIWAVGALLAAAYAATALCTWIVWSDRDRWYVGERHGRATQWKGSLTMGACVLAVVPFCVLFVIQQL